MSLLLANLVLLLLALQPAVAFAAVGDGTQHHQRQSLYRNVFFSELPRMKGRPSTSFVMVKSEDGRAYQLSSSGKVVTFTGPGGEAQASGRAQETCPHMPHKPAFMCANRLNTCWSVGQADVDCPGAGLCCFDGCVNTCKVSPPSEAREVRSGGHQCPDVQQRTEAECSNATANCWSRGVPDVDCPDYGLCCFDGCVNTCIEEEEDLEYDQSLSNYDEEDYDEELDDSLSDEDEELDEEMDDYLDEDLDDEQDEELDDELDDFLDEGIDEYGAPKAPIVTLEDLDSYGSPLGDALDSYGSPAAPVNGIISPFYPYKASNYQNIGPVPASNQIVSYNDFKSSSRLPRYSFPSKTYQKAYNQNLQFPKSSSHYSSFSKKKQDSRKITRKKLFLSKSEKKHQSHAETVLSALENLWKKHFGVFTKF